MSVQIAAGVLAAALVAQDVNAASAPAVPVDSTAADAPVAVSEYWTAPVVPSQTVIRRAVRESILDEKELAIAASKAAAIPERYTMSSHPTLTKYERFEQGFAAAKIPGCLQRDGLKHQPTFIFGGLLALPFIPIAALRGKCN